MGVRVERFTHDVAGCPTTGDCSEKATEFWYDPADKVMYIQSSDRSGDLTVEANIAAYPKGSYVRVWLDPVPELPELHEGNEGMRDIDDDGFTRDEFGMIIDRE